MLLARMSLLGAVLGLMLKVISSSSPPLPVFPEGISEWRLAERATFDRSNLFDFIDGGAEVYLAYDFRHLSVALYRAAEKPDIAVELYDMGSSDDAYGVLSVDPTGEHVELGTMARYGAGLLRLCKGRWFIRILAERETRQSRGAVLDLGASMGATIAEDSLPPRLLGLLPKEGLRADSATYFHTLTTLNQLYYLSDGNLLGLGPDNEAVLAEYEARTGDAKLLIVRYPSEEHCLSARDMFVTRYLEVDASVQVALIHRVEETGFVGIQAAPPYLIVVLDGLERSLVETLLERTIASLARGEEDG